MLKFAGEKPVVFEILLIIASFLLSLVFMFPFQAIIGWPTELAGGKKDRTYFVKNSQLESSQSVNSVVLYTI